MTNEEAKELPLERLIREHAKLKDEIARAVRNVQKSLDAMSEDELLQSFDPNTLKGNNPSESLRTFSGEYGPTYHSKSYKHLRVNFIYDTRPQDSKFYNAPRLIIEIGSGLSQVQRTLTGLKIKEFIEALMKRHDEKY